MSKKKEIKYGYLIVGNDGEYKKCKVKSDHNGWVCVVPSVFVHCFEKCGTSSNVLKIGKVGETFFYDERDAKIKALQIKNYLLTKDHNDLDRKLRDLEARVMELENRPWWRIWK